MYHVSRAPFTSRTAPLTAKQQALVHNLPPEFNDTKHVKGIVSMARGDAPDSATTSFFICTGASAPLDGVYTAFGRVVDGMAAVDAIEAAPRTGEAPNTRIDLKRSDEKGCSGFSPEERPFQKYRGSVCCARVRVDGAVSVGPSHDP